MIVRSLALAAVLLAPSALSAQGTAAPAKTKPASPVDVEPAVLDVLRKAFAAQVAKGSYRALMQLSVGGNVMPSLEIEVVYPGRVRLKRSGLEMISVAGKAMARQGDKWTPAPEGVNKFIGSFGDSKDDEKMLNEAIYAKNLGPSKIDDRVVTGFEVHSKGKAGLAKTKIFITTDDGLVRRVESKGELKGREVNFTALLGDYGVPIQIELPK